MDQVAADHQSSSALACLAVDSHDISIVSPHEGVDIFTELIDHLEGRRLMIIEPEILTLLVKAPVTVSSLAAQVVHFIKAGMFPAEEFLNISHGVAVNGLEALTWETHCDDPRCHIGQI